LSRMELAQFRASCTIWPSVAKDAMCSSTAMPLCIVPSMSPGPRIRRSASATTNPSVVEVMTSRRLRVSLAIFSMFSFLIYHFYYVNNYIYYFIILSKTRSFALLALGFSSSSLSFDIIGFFVTIFPYDL